MLGVRSASETLESGACRIVWDETMSLRMKLRVKKGHLGKKYGGVQIYFYTFENMYLKSEKITPTKIERVKRYMTLFINFAKRD